MCIKGQRFDIHDCISLIIEKDLKDVCNLLCRVKEKLSKIGVQLGILPHKLEEFKKEYDTLMKTTQ